MAYTKQAWVNAPDTSTPIFAAQLQHIEDGIANIYTTLALNAPPTWVKSTLIQSLDAIAHPFRLMVIYNSGWNVNAALQADGSFSWLFIGGTSTTPPPSTVGPQVWDRAAGGLGATGIQPTITEPLNA